MVKLLKHKINGYWLVKDYENGKTVKFDNTEKPEAVKCYKRMKNNAKKRAKNRILTELCGTSARQVKIDMGL